MSEKVLRRTTRYDEDVWGGLCGYRAAYIRAENKNKKFGPAVNELLREILTQKGYIK